MAKATAGKTPPDNKKKTEDPPAADDGKKAEDPPAADDGKKTEDPPAKTFTQADIDRAVEKAVKEAEKKAAAAEAKAKLSEDERLKAENDELREDIRRRDARDAVTEALQKAGAKSPQLLFRSIEGDLQFDERGNLTNVADVVKGLTIDFPEQFGTEAPAGGVDAGKGSKDKPPALTRAAIEKMTPQEVLQNEDAINDFLASGAI